jgi:glycosyltransferase involved in cell wall biosynthesis
MKVAVVIPTYGRPELAARLLRHLEGQTRLPDEVVLSAPTVDHVPVYTPDRLKVVYLLGRTGLAAQRNNALDYVLPRCDVVSFIDDDFLPEDNYVARIVELFECHSDWVVVMGKLVCDGALGHGVGFDDGLALLRAAERRRPEPKISFDNNGAYGCNMAIRASCIGPLRFDERLVLYGWQEDVDFTSQLRPFGKLVRPGEPLGVHLGIKSGKVSGVRFGYSQIVNPLYLVRKGTLSTRFALRLALRNFAANVLRSINPEPYIDRRGRLRGNLLALAHVARGRLDPEYVLKI